MTLIFASHPPDSPPFMVADCLLSRPGGGGDENIDLPSARNEDAPEGLIVNRLAKKLYILHPHVAVCWAGTYIQAKSFLNRLSELVKNTANFDESFFYEAGLILREQDEHGRRVYEDIDVILSAYDKKTQDFRSVHSGVKAADFPRIGLTYYGGSGVSYLENMADHLSRPETLSGTDGNPIHVSWLTECRALTLAYNIMLNECINNPEELSLHYLYGGMVECCYFDFLGKTFKYIDGVKLLFWPIQYETKPHYKFFFGMAPRSKEEADKNIFYSYENAYTEKGLVLRRYENNSLDKTPEGHIVDLKEYAAENLVPSIFPFDEKKRGKYSLNVYYVLGEDMQKVSNRYIYLEFDAHEPWISLSVMQDGRYDLRISKRAFDTSKQLVDDFMMNGYRSRSSQGEPFDPAELFQARQLIGQGVEAKRRGSPEDLQASIKLYDDAKKIFERNQDLHGVVEATRLMGASYELSQDYPAAEKAFLGAMEEFKKLGSLKEYASCLLSLGILYKNLLRQSREADNVDYSFFAKSYEKLIECLRINENLKDKGGVIRSINTMAGLQWQGNNFGLAIDAAVDAVKLAREHADGHLLAMCLKTSGYVKINHHTINDNIAQRTPIDAGVKDWEEAHDIFKALGHEYRAQKLMADIQGFKNRQV